MYHPLVVEKEQALLEKRLGRKLERYEPEYCWDVEAHLKRLWDPEKGLLRALRKDESEFITNERLLCSIDFLYWTRYAWLLPDAAVGDGGLMRFQPWRSQEIVLAVIKEMELAAYEAAQRGEAQDGSLVAVPKARQEGISLLAAVVKMHRLTTSPYTLGITASENEAKRTALYQRDVRLWEQLPWWLRPERTAPDIINERLTFGKLDASMLYQDYAQESSLAAGEQYLIGHMSELAQGDQAYVEKLMTLDYFPAIPQSWRSCHLLESTPAGMGGFWHPFITDAYKGLDRWRVCFIPWYVNSFKYRRTPPSDWVPSKHTLDHAGKVEETSPEYLSERVTLGKDQLFWWETTREEYRRKGNLPYFLTNYPATLEESFQFAGISIFDQETLEYYRTNTRQPGGVYEIQET